MLYSDIPLAQGVIELIKSYEIKHIVISPGSRNAPLTIGFNEDSYFTCYSIVDERCAGFFALGIAQQIQQPVVLVCTSGSALLNYYPALSEAFYSQIPFIVLSADRPLNKIDIGDGQTIRQQNVFANHTWFNANLTEDWTTENNDLINQAIQQSIANRGPVHINAPFEEPLYGTTTTLSVVINKLPKEKLVRTLPQLEWNICTESWENATKKLILIGSLNEHQISEETLQNWINDTSVVVFTEVQSNIRNEKFINSIDTLITSFISVDFEYFKPEILVTIGGMIVSKRIKSFLRKYQPQEHWHIGELRAYDTFECLTKHVKLQPEVFFEELYSRVQEIPASEYQTNILKLKIQRQQKQSEFAPNVPFSDFYVYDELLKKITPNFQLQIGNSSAIRYVQLFDIPEDLEVFSNRGTSGIDGSTSTAIGATVGQQKPVILFTGDISFFYDSNALWNNYIPDSFKIVIINNSGGGIFRILPGHQEKPVFHTYFETQHQLSATHLAQMFDFEYFQAQDKPSFQTNYQTFLNSPKKAIFEVFTPTDVNDVVLKEYFESLV